MLHIWNGRQVTEKLVEEHRENHGLKKAQSATQGEVQPRKINGT
jgi:hypothetical protein